MVINHNLLAMNAQRQLGINRGKKAKLWKSWPPAIRLTVLQMMQPG